MNELTKDTKKSMKSRIITSFILLTIALPAVLAGGWYFLVLVAIALSFMINEFINAPKHESYSFWLHVFIYIMTFSFVYWIFIKNNLAAHEFRVNEWSLETGFDQILVSTIGVAVVVFVLFLVSILHSNFKIEDVTYLFTMIVYIGLSVQSLVFLRFYPEHISTINNDFNPTFLDKSMLVVYVVGGTFLSDIGAYFVGVLMGKHKINPRISPKKTWEGFFGGVIFSALISFSFGMIMAKLGHPILPFLDTDQWFWLLLISLVMPLTANLGDFIFSALKRHYNIKDYGTLLRGHGGVLDRVDSLLCTCLTVSIILTFINNSWNFLI